MECIHGIRLAGAMEVKEMIDFCREHGIQLLVDAAHPFAEQLHKNIGQAAEELNIPVVDSVKVTDVNGKEVGLPDLV